MISHLSFRPAGTIAVVISMFFFAFTTPSVGDPLIWSIKPTVANIGQLHQFSIKPKPYHNFFLPEAYDLRDVGRAAPIYPEGDSEETPCAVCWSSAATYILESLLLPWENTDLSQDHMQLTVNGECYGGTGPERAIAYLAAWNGPISESDYQSMQNMPDQLQEVSERLRLMQGRYLPPRTDPLDNDAIKSAIYHHGPLYASVSWRGMTNQANNSYYFPDYSPIHAVALIGWDDHYPKENFTYSIQGTTYTPDGDGAFIAKNNDGRFFHLSYYDGTVGYANVIWFEVKPVDNQQDIYQHDPNGTLDYICPHQIPDNAPFVASIYGANLFTARTRSTLTSIGFSLHPYDLPEGEHAEFEVEIHLDPDVGPVNTAGPELSFTVRVYTGGYISIELPMQIPLAAYQEFSVVIRGYRSTGINDAECLPVENGAPLYDLNHEIAISRNESFISIDGLTWFDMFDVPSSKPQSETMEYFFGNLGIKAYTQASAENLVESKNLLTHIGLANNASRFILVQPVRPPFQFDTAPVPESTTPQNGATVTTDPIISVRFNDKIHSGPALAEITLTSFNETLQTTCSIAGDTLSIYPNGQLGSSDLHGKQWTVRLPAEAVVDRWGNPMDQAFAWSFEVIGVN